MTGDFGCDCAGVEGFLWLGTGYPNVESMGKEWDEGMQSLMTMSPWRSSTLPIIYFFWSREFKTLEPYIIWCYWYFRVSKSAFGPTKTHSHPLRKGILRHQIAFQDMFFFFGCWHMWISVIDFFSVESSCTTRDQVKLSEPIEHPAVRAQGWWRSWGVKMRPVW